MKRNYTIKDFEYIRRGVKYGVPIKIKHKGKTYKFATALLRVAIELKDQKENILCLRVMKTLTIEDRIRSFNGEPTRLVLDEYFYKELEPDKKTLNC